MGKRREEHAYSEEGNQKRKEDQGARVRVERRAKVTAEVRMVAQIVLPGKRKRMVAAERPAGMGQRELEDLREDEGSSPLSSITEMEREEEVNLASKSCRPEEMGVARWVGERVGREEENELYESFAKNGDVISLLDCVYVKPEEKDQAAYIMRIRKLWGCSTTGQMKFRGQWLYRPQDTKHGSSCCLHAREVFLSDWEDENPIDCVQTKCNVLFLDKPPTREADASDSCQPSSPLGRRFHYVCWRSYSVHTGEIRELADSLPGRKKTNPMSQRLKELRGEQEVLLLQVSDGRRAREAMQEAGHLYADALSSMPIQHISRLILSQQTYTLVLRKKLPAARQQVTAAATMRRHNARNFLELELFAVKLSEQRKGLGCFLLDKVVAHARLHGLRWILTYADDTAVPFFLSCGFTRKVTIAKSVYAPVMTEYEHTLLLQRDIEIEGISDHSDYPFLF